MFGKISDLTIRTKIFGLIAIMIVGLGVFGIVSFDTLNTVKVNGPLYHEIIENKDLVADILPPPEYLVEAYLVVLQMLDEQDKSKLDEMVRRSAKLREEYETRHVYWEKSLAPGNLRDTMVIASYGPAKEFLDLRDREFIPAILGRDLKKARALAQGELKKLYDEHRSFIDKVVVLATQKTETDERNVHSMIEQRMVTQLSFAFAIVIISFLAAYSLSRHISGVVNEYLAFAGQVARGDLTVRLRPRSHDELGALGEHLNGMAQNLSEMSEKIRTSTQEITLATTDILVIVQQLGASTAKTSSAVAETTTTIEQVKQAAKMVSEKARKVAESARESVEISDSGRKATEDTVRKMDLIKNQMESIGDTVIRLSERSQAIEDIIATVQDLADQSNLLAVNASIEAARAGDQGRGFAVVAHEIKTLADQSKQATDQIRAILEDTRKWVSAVVMATEQGGKAVDAGVAQSIVAGDSIQSLANRVAESSQVTAVIHVSSDQQSAGVDQVAAAMGNIETAIQQNVGGTNQLEAAGRKLEGLGNTLKELVARYKV